MTILVELIVDRDVNGGEFLRGAGWPPVQAPHFSRLATQIAKGPRKPRSGDAECAIQRDISIAEFGAGRICCQIALLVRCSGN
jgi:hypothetical protein